MKVIPDIEKIRDLQRPYSQEAFCKKCGISRQTLKRIYDGHRVDEETVITIAAAFGLQADDLILPEPTEERLCDLITKKGLWPEMVEAFRSIAVIAGTSAQRTYTAEASHTFGPSQGETILAGQNPSEKNPTIPADVDAMLSTVKTSDLFIRPFADKLACGVSYLAEELIKDGSTLAPYLGTVADRVHGAEGFFSLRLNVLRLISDPLDGSMNHKRGIPTFCSAAALLVEDQPRVAAIFDPVHDIVYSALLPGPYDKPERGASASAWEVSTGHTTDLIEISRNHKPENLMSEAIAIHLPRSNSDKRQTLISKLEALATTVDSLYMLNCGIQAMVLAAKGGLVAFINPWTNLHDIAPGEVLCRATGCLVTDSEGHPIKYNGLAKDPSGKPIAKTSLVVARKEVHSEVLKLIQ